MANKGIAAFAQLPKVKIVFVAGETCSIDAIRAAMYKVGQMQLEGTPDATYSEVPCNKNKGGSAVWEIVVSGSKTIYTLTFVSETGDQLAGGRGRKALSERRLIDFAVSNADEYSVRSGLALLNMIEGLEDLVAEAGGVSATADATYTNAKIRGATPFEEFTWTVTKSGLIYSCVPTANS